MKKIVDFYKNNSVLFNFYLLFGYFSILFYFFLHWRVTTDYIAVYLPIMIARSVAFVLSVFGYSTSVAGPIVSVQSFRFTIIYHCAGIFGMMIYAAAVLAYKARWYEKLYGLVIGIAGLYLINTVRMAVLGIIGLYWRDYFDFYHEFLWQGIFIIFVIAFWVFWKEKLIRDPFASESSSENPEPAK